MELVAEVHELFADFFVVVDFAVKNDPGGAVLIGDRLLAGFQIDNRKTTHRHSDMPLDIEAILVRPAVADCLIHAIEQLPVNRLPVPANHSCYATHVICSDCLAFKLDSTFGDLSVTRCRMALLLGAAEYGGRKPPASLLRCACVSLPVFLSSARRPPHKDKIENQNLRALSI